MSKFLIAEEINLNCQEGDTFTETFTIPSAINMDNFTTVKFQVKRRLDDTEILIDKQTGGSGITVSSQDITISFTSDDTAGLPGRYFWEMQIENATPQVIKICKGYFLIKNQLINNS